MGGTFTGNVSISGTLASGALTVTGTGSFTTGVTLASSSGNVGIGIAHGSADGKLHVVASAVAGFAPDVSTDDLTLEINASGGQTIGTPDNTTGTYAIGSPSESKGMYWNWAYSSGLGNIVVDKVGARIDFYADATVKNLTLEGASGSETAVFAGTVQATDGLGTNGVTPVGQASAIADPTDLTTSISAIEDILVVIENLGFIAT